VCPKATDGTRTRRSVLSLENRLAIRSCRIDATREYRALLKEIRDAAVGSAGENAITDVAKPVTRGKANACRDNGRGDRRRIDRGCSSTRAAARKPEHEAPRRAFGHQGRAPVYCAGTGKLFHVLPPFAVALSSAVARFVGTRVTTRVPNVICPDETLTGTVMTDGGWPVTVCVTVTDELLSSTVKVADGGSPQLLIVLAFFE
jgi:hypothetical protein